MNNNNELPLKKITPTNDIVFKRIFGMKGNEKILKHLLESLLDIKIASLTVHVGTELLPEFYDGKNSRLDIHATLHDGTLVDIEVQTNLQDYSDKRNLSYWSKLYLSQLKRGQDYCQANKAICIWIVDGTIYDFEKYHSKWIVSEEELGKISPLYQDFEIHVIELQKFNDSRIIEPSEEEINDKEKRNKDFWLWFIGAKRQEMVEMACKSREELRKAKEEYDKIMSDDEFRHYIDREELAEWDTNTRISLAKREGTAEGKLEGKHEEKLETAKKMLELGLDIEIIVKSTDLTKEEIEKLKD